MFGIVSGPEECGMLQKCGASCCQSVRRVETIAHDKYFATDVEALFSLSV